MSIISKLPVSLLACFSMLFFASSSLAASSATITVNFASNKLSASIASSKDVSHYTVTLCSGALPKVEGNNLGHNVNLGPYSSPIVSVQVKAGTTNNTYYSGVNCSNPGTSPPSQSITCDYIEANYHRPLVNGDHINATISPGGQVNMYVDLNIAGGHNTMGLRWKIFGVQQSPIPLTQAQVNSGIITFNYGPVLSQNSWTITFVQTNETDTWPNLRCNKTPPPPPSCPNAPSPLPIGANANGVLFNYVASPSSWSAISGQTVMISITGLTQANVLMGVATYKANGPTWPTSLPQTSFDSDTDTLNGCETIEFEVKVPNCYYQIDFFTGAILTGDQLNNGQRYGSRKIKWANGGTASCMPPKPKKTKLEITKTSYKKNVKIGAGNTFKIKVKNVGNADAYNTVACDDLPQAWKYLSATGSPVVTGRKICWTIGTLEKGKTATFKIKVKLLGVITSTTVSNTLGEHVYVSKQEMQVDVEAGQTRTVTLSCGSGYVTDGAIRVDHVDQGTGTLESIEITDSHAIDKNTYQFTLTNHATGRSQSKAFVTCLSESTVQTSQDLVVSNQLHTASSMAVGVGQLQLTCQNGQQPIAVGYNILSGSARSIASENVGSSGWRMSFNVTSPAQIEMTMRCLNEDLAGGNSRLIFTHIVRTVTIQPGQVVSESVSCGDQAKGIVATYDLPPTLILLGHDPQPKIRVFKLYNPTGSAITATIDLVCINDRTSGKIIKHYAKKAFNSAYASATNAKKVRTTISVNVVS